MTPEAAAAILGMAAGSYACRAAGFWLMAFVPVTARIRAGLEAIPIAVMAAVLAPAAARGGVAEGVGLVTAVTFMRVTGNDLLGALGGVAAVALVRALAA